MVNYKKINDSFSGKTEMDITHLTAEEKTVWKLRAFFENRGFHRINVNKFEEYNLYVDNQSFLETDNIISFMDINGKLLALKPDITLSIVKNMPKAAQSHFQRLYYIDEVYRLSRENQEYKVLNQIGIELIGPADDFSNVEIITLALNSLALIDDNYILDISHLGFISGVFDVLELANSLRAAIMAELRSKSMHNIRTILLQQDISESHILLIEQLCSIQGSFSHVIPKLKNLVEKISSDSINDAFNEIKHIGEVADLLKISENINLDFSVVGDLDYYNGIVFAGYVKGIPTDILTGGRYDNLMKKMKKQSCALGFGICLSSLEQYMKNKKKKNYDCDYLLLYDSSNDSHYQAKLIDAATLLNNNGFSVRLEKLGLNDGEKFPFTFENSFHLDKSNIDEFIRKNKLKG